MSSGVLVASLAKLYDELANLESTLPQKDATTTPEFDPEKHPLLKKNTEKVEPVKALILEHSGRGYINPLILFPSFFLTLCHSNMADT